MKKQKCLFRLVKQALLHTKTGCIAAQYSLFCFSMITTLIYNELSSISSFKEFALGVLNLSEGETAHALVHQSLYLVVAEVAR